MRDPAFGGPHGVNSIARPGFLDEQWLTRLQIARVPGEQLTETDAANVIEQMQIWLTELAPVE